MINQSQESLMSRNNGLADEQLKAQKWLQNLSITKRKIFKLVEDKNSQNREKATKGSGSILKAYLQEGNRGFEV